MPQTVSKKDLPDLPESADKEFWGEAEVITNLTPQKIHKEEPHFFIRIAGREAQCNHCDWGFALDPGDKIIEGHLYDKKGTLVI